MNDFAMCFDDDRVIADMKKDGVWKSMKRLSRPGVCINIILPPKLYTWHGKQGDSGYTCCETSNLGLLLDLAKIAMDGKPIDYGKIRGGG